MADSKTFEVIYHNGQPDGIRLIRQHFSPMMTYVVPRPLLSEAKKISGTDRPGIYYLIRENEENGIARIYVGQTRNGISRLDDHNRQKDFWNKAILFLADSQTFSLDIISGLEEHAIEKARGSKRYTVENSVKPKFVIDEYDLRTIEKIYSEIRFVMATQGYKMNDAAEDWNKTDMLHTTRNGILAFGVYDGDKFEVLDGSQINMERPAALERYNQLRADLLNTGTISLSDGKYVLHTTIEFKTPSGAGDFVLGGSTNGWTEWKNSENKTLDALFRKP